MTTPNGHDAILDAALALLASSGLAPEDLAAHAAQAAPAGGPANPTGRDPTLAGLDPFDPPGRRSARPAFPTGA